MKKKPSVLWTLLFSALSVLWLYPLFVVLINSVKKKAYISRVPFQLPLQRTFAGFANYEKGVELTNFLSSMAVSLIITVLSVTLILLCTSMCAWFITRVRTMSPCAKRAGAGASRSLGPPRASIGPTWAALTAGGIGARASRGFPSASSASVTRPRSSISFSSAAIQIS